MGAVARSSYLVLPKIAFILGSVVLMGVVTSFVFSRVKSNTSLAVGRFPLPPPLKWWAHAEGLQKVNQSDAIFGRGEAGGYTFYLKGVVQVTYPPVRLDPPPSIEIAGISIYGAIVGVTLLIERSADLLISFEIPSRLSFGKRSIRPVLHAAGHSIPAEEEISLDLSN
jgi:hypothetical protein